MENDDKVVQNLNKLIYRGKGSLNDYVRTMNMTVPRSIFFYFDNFGAIADFPESEGLEEPKRYVELNSGKINVVYDYAKGEAKILDLNSESSHPEANSVLGDTLKAYREIESKVRMGDEKPKKESQLIKMIKGLISLKR